MAHGHAHTEHGGSKEIALLIAVHALVDGMTQEEVAGAMRLSRKTVGLRLQKFLSQARALLGNELAQGMKP